MQRFAVPQNAKRVRAQTATDRLDDGEHRSSGDGSIHRIATLPQDTQARLRGQGVGSGNDVAGEYGETCAGVGIGKVKGHDFSVLRTL